MGKKLTAKNILGDKNFFFSRRRDDLVRQVMPDSPPPTHDTRFLSRIDFYSLVRAMTTLLAIPKG